MGTTRNMKGVILCGGTGSRLFPLTKSINKHLLPVCGKPMAQWAIEKLVEAGVTEILVISGQEQCGSIINQFGDGSDYGCSLTYKVQSKAGGIAQALKLAEEFAGKDPVCVILGDNIFSFSLASAVAACRKPRWSGAEIFLKKVDDPTRFGVADINLKNEVISIEEKPKRPKSRLAVTGIYIYDSTVFSKISEIKPSARGELEITDVNNMYIKEKKMHASILEEDDFWSDAGTHESYAYVNKNFNPEKKQ